MWSIGCIFGELLTLRPLIKGDEVTAENNKTIPFQIHQVTKMCHVLGTPTSKSH
jgi:cyclin-dependent kinase 8/11